MTAAPTPYGKYQLLERIARGGMAEVYRAKSLGVEGFEKVLVIKRILPELAQHPDFVEMFINEAKIAVTLSHANIVQVFDLGRADDSYFIAMEYVAGVDLSTLLRRGAKTDNPLPPELAVYIGSEVAKGLDYAHRRRDVSGEPLHIVHRDVSPQNVLLSFDGEVKITDFGIAKARTSVQGTEAGVLKGKYSFMSPEQARGERVDHRTDIFALGTLMYMCITGENPFRKDSTYDTLQAVREADVPWLSEVVEGVPEELSQVIHACLAKEREERPQTAGRVYEDLMQFLFSAGRRVRAHSLAEYIEQVQTARNRGSRDRVDDARIRASFAPDRPVEARRPRAEREAEDITPVERPRTAAPPPDPFAISRTTTDSGLSAVARPQAEQRDMTVAVLGPLAMPTPRSVAERVRWYGGEVLRRKSSDGQFEVALFGLDSPDGRETEAAARAMLDLRRRRREAGLGALQVGLHTGRVLVDISGALLRDARYKALIAEATACARSAGPGQILASAAAERVIHRDFETRRVVGADYRQIIEERSLTAAAVPFVGRRAELQRIGEAIASAGRGRRTLLGLVGDAGVGKTRILLETMLRLRRDHHPVTMHVVRLERARQLVPLSTAQELVRVVLGIDEHDTKAELDRKLGRLPELGLDEHVSLSIRQLLGLAERESHPAEGDRPLRAAIAQLGAALARDQPMLVAFDGMQNVDRQSLGVLQAILTRPEERAAILAILAYRPGPGQPWRELPEMQEIPIGPLEPDETRQLIGACVGTQELPADLIREVSDKSGGNPLYVEEYIHALREAGALEAKPDGVRFRREVAEVEVPKSLRGIVASRLAALSPTERHLLQIAGVADGNLRVSVLARVADEDVETVREAVGILAHRGVIVVEDDHVSFAHELTAEVLRSGLPPEARRELHGAVAATLEEVYPDQLDALAERLAHHHELAGTEEVAVHYLERAARRLAAENAFDGALEAAQKALDLLVLAPSGGPDARFALYRLLGELSFEGRQLRRGAERMAAAYELAQALKRPADVAHFAMMRGLLLSHANRFKEARVWLDRAREVARTVADAGILGEVTVATADALARAGDYGGAVGLLREALAVTRESGQTEAQVRCLAGLARALAAAGDEKGARAAMWEAWELTPSGEDGAPAFTRCTLHMTEARVHFYLSDPSDTIESARRASDIAKAHGFSYEEAEAALLMGESNLRLEQVRRAFSHLRHAYELSHARGYKKLEHHSLRMLGFLDATKFNSQAGRDRVVRAVAFAEREGYLTDQIEGHYLLAYIDAQRGAVDEARRGFEQAHALAQEYGHAHFEHVSEAALEALRQGEGVSLPR